MINKLVHIYILIFLFPFSFMSGQEAELSLSKAINLALENNYGISISKSELDIAGINNDWGIAGRYPTIGFDVASVNNYDLSDKGLLNRISGGISLNWIIFDGFRVNITKSKLENTELLSSGRLAVMVENTVEDIILSYYAILLEKEKLAVLKKVRDLSGDRYEYMLKKKALGSSVTYEVLQAESVYLSDKAAYLDQEMRVRSTIRNLNFIMAEDPALNWELTENFEADTTHYQLSDLHSKMVESNQVLQNQYTNLLLSQNETSLRKAALSPTITTSIGMDNSVTFNGIRGMGTQQLNSYSPYANLHLSWDIYKGGVRKRALEIARINEEIAQVEINEMQHALTNELYNLFDYHEVRMNLLEVAEQSMESATLNLQISEEKYKSGVINSFNYRDVQLIYLDASLRKLQSIYNLIDSRTKLSRITGGFVGTAGE